MKNETRGIRAKLKAGKTTTMVRWEFRRGQERLTCEVDREADAAGGGTFAVISLPYQKFQRASVEVFENAITALRRHAMLAADLRAAGWKLVAYTS